MTTVTQEEQARVDLKSILKDKEEELKRKSLKKKRKTDKYTMEVRRALILLDYSKGLTTIELEEKYNLHRADIRAFINLSLSNLMNFKERNVLRMRGCKDQVILQRSLQKLKDMELITETFLSLLSPSSSPTLSDEEALFAQLYIRTGNSEEAIKGAGLDDGLVNTGAGYRRAILVRSSYLREKPNVKGYIDTLRSSLFSPQDIEKGKIQELLIEEIYKMKEEGNPRDKTNLRQTIELLGKTIGAFTEKVEIHEVDPSKSLDALIEMATEATVKEIEDGSQ